ncbi:MAG: phosphate acyltransferase PlsX [Chloroflexi bacterium]|nr:phosphate acyltransferase PlsX [Chloroflexota bacterium]
MRIALDAMGGDKAPAETVKGAVAAAKTLGIEVLLVGRREEIETELSKHKTAGLPLRVIDAPDVIDMGEPPAQAVRRKPNSSLVIATQLSTGEADAMVSAGNSGAAMAACLFKMGRIEGIERPAIAGLIPTFHGRVLVIDIGANTECRPDNLLQFAIMGSIYMQKVCRVTEPRVALLSNGEEDTKGTALVKETHKLLRSAPVLFTGNIEAKDVPFNTADVVVTDGFTGNILLKMGEGVVSMMTMLIKQELSRDILTKLASAPLIPAFDRIKSRLDYAEYGGAPLLGVNGVGIIAHGRSDAKAVRNAIRAAKHAVEEGTVEAIKSMVKASAPAANK